jgi:hypothetical protein
MRNLLMAFTTALLWAIVCGLLLGTFSLLAISDPGHVGRGLEAILVGSMSAFLGFFAGLVFSSIALAVPLRLRGGFVAGAVASIGAAIIFGALMFASAHAASATAFARWLHYTALEMVVVTLVAAVLGGILGTGTLWLSGKRSTAYRGGAFAAVTPRKTRNGGT